MRFDLNDLQLFVHILDSGTMTAAAQRAHITLAAASERVRGMEAQLGCALLLRQPRGVLPTAAGHTLGQHARQVLQQMQSLRGAMGDFGAGLAGQLRLRGNTSAVREHLPMAISGFLLQHPLMALELQECTSADVLAGLRRGDCDIGIAACSPEESSSLAGLSYRPWRADPLVAVLAKSHRLAHKAQISLQDLAPEHWVGLPRESALQMLLQKRASQLDDGLGQPLRMRVQLPHFEGICQLVGQSVGVAILPLAGVARHASATQVATVPLSDDWAQRQLLLCWVSQGQRPPVAQQLLAHLQTLADTADAPVHQG